MKKLTLIEAAGLAKIADEAAKTLVKNGESIPVGNHPIDFTVKVKGLLTKKEDTQSLPSFSMNGYLKALLLKYADQIASTKEINTEDLTNEGACLAENIGPYKAGTVLTAKILKALFKSGVTQVLVRCDGREWLRSLMDIEAALGAVVQLGSDAVINSVDPALVALYESAEAAAKTKFQTISKKANRTGATTAIADVDVVERVEVVKPPQLKARSAKRKA